MKEAYQKIIEFVTGVLSFAGFTLLLQWQLPDIALWKLMIIAALITLILYGFYKLDFED